MEVLSDEGALLRTWSLIESAASEDRFYEESSWRFYHPKDDTYVWAFDLLPEELLPIWHGILPANGAGIFFIKTYQDPLFCR